MIRTRTATVCITLAATMVHTLEDKRLVALARAALRSIRSASQRKNR